MPNTEQLLGAFGFCSLCCQGFLSEELLDILSAVNTTDIAACAIAAGTSQVQGWQRLDNKPTMPPQCEVRELCGIHMLWRLRSNAEIAASLSCLPSSGSRHRRRKPFLNTMLSFRDPVFGCDSERGISTASRSDLVHFPHVQGAHFLIAVHLSHRGHLQFMVGQELQ